MAVPQTLTLSGFLTCVLFFIFLLYLFGLRIIISKYSAKSALRDGFSGSVMGILGRFSLNIILLISKLANLLGFVK